MAWYFWFDDQKTSGYLKCINKSIKCLWADLNWATTLPPFTTSVFVPMLLVGARLTGLTLSLCSVPCLMFPCKETLLDCEGETQPLNPSSPPCNGPPPFCICNLTQQGALHVCLAPLSQPSASSLLVPPPPSDALLLVAVPVFIQRHRLPTAQADQKRSVTFTENQEQQTATGGSKPPTPSKVEAPAEPKGPALSKSPTLEVPPSVSATVTADLHRPANAQVNLLMFAELSST